MTSNNLLTPGQLSTLAGVRHVALDMDGTIYMGSHLFPFTIPFLERLTRLGVTYSFLTNNPSRSIADYLAKLRKMGIEARPDHIYNTTMATIDYLHTHLPGASNLFLLGTPSMISQFREAGFRSADDSAAHRPDALVVAFDMTLTYERLCRAAWWASQGVPYVATNPDFVCPTNESTVLVDCGSICRCIEAATGRRPDVTLGKPDPNMLIGIQQQHHLEPHQILMVGDRIYTDIAMAHNAGAPGCLVLTGETTEDAARRAPQQPTLILPSIEQLGLCLEEAKS